MKVGLFLNSFNFNNHKDIVDAVPDKGFKRFLFILSNHFFNLISLNLVFLLSCMPIITIPAALFALTNVVMVLYHTGTYSFYNDYFLEFKNKFFLIIIPVFLLALFPISVVLWFFIFGYSNLGIGVGIILVPFSFLALIYFMFLTAVNKNSTTENMKKSLLMVFRNLSTSIKLVFTPLSLYFLGIHLLPFTLIPTIFVLFSVGQLFVCFLLEGIIKPLSS